MTYGTKIKTPFSTSCDKECRLGNYYNSEWAILSVSDWERRGRVLSHETLTTKGFLACC